MKKMSKGPFHSQSATAWKRLFGDALRENDPKFFNVRLRDAKNAIMDRIEDTMRTASQAERRLLLTALNTLRELQRAIGSEPTREGQSKDQELFRTIGGAA